MADRAALVRQWHRELLAEGRLDRVPEIFSAGYQVHANGRTMSGRDFVASFLKTLRSAFPDLRVEVEVLIDDGDRVALVRTLRGTHEGPLAGFPPTGREVRWQELLVSRFDGDRIAEEWASSGLAERLLATRATARGRRGEPDV